MSIIQITETGRGARRRPTVTPADGKIWIPSAVVAGERVERAWTGSHVLEFDEGVPAVRPSSAQPHREPHRLRTLAPLAGLLAVWVALTSIVSHAVAAA